MITVFHASKLMHQDAIHYHSLTGTVLSDFLRNNWSEFQAVAIINSSDLEQAKRLTQSICDVWWNNLDVQLCRPDQCVKINNTWIKGHRDTAVGDILIADQQAYMVDNFGFKKVDINTEKIPHE